MDTILSCIPNLLTWSGGNNGISTEDDSIASSRAVNEEQDMREITEL